MVLNTLACSSVVPAGVWQGRAVFGKIWPALAESDKRGHETDQHNHSHIPHSSSSVERPIENSMFACQPCTGSKKSHQGSQQRLRDIQIALSQASHEERIKNIKLALSQSDVPAQPTQTNVLTIQVNDLKRTASCTPESPPRAKRQQLLPDSPDWSPMSSPTSSPILSPGSLPDKPATNSTSPPTSVHSSQSPEPSIKLLSHDVRDYRQQKSQYTDFSNFRRSHPHFLHHGTSAPTSSNSFANTQALYSTPRRHRRHSSRNCAKCLVTMKNGEWLHGRGLGTRSRSSLMTHMERRWMI